MKTNRILAGATLAVLLVAGMALRTHAADAKAPDVAGKWTGTWGPYFPEGTPAPKGFKPMPLDCTVSDPKDGEWAATFTGEAGGKYKYTIKMMGRQAGNCVLFKGTTDLGAASGGVYDWIGRADGKEFLGFYTSSTHTGTFRLKRPE